MGLSRRQLFRLRPAKLLSMAFDKTDSAKKKVFFRPPGALPEVQFLSACERCGSCAKACPHDVIFKLGPETGNTENTPYLDPRESPCHWCTSFDCIQACPSGALLKLEDQQPKAIGKAVVDMSSCLISAGTICDECRTVCPAELKAIKIFDRQIHIDTDICSGCGLCSYYCDNAGAAISIQNA